MAVSRTFYVAKNKLSSAQEFIMEHGRDIEKVLFKHYFKNEPISSVVSILERYCNKDGGVGGMELDMSYRGSTPISCSIFFCILNEIKVTAEFGSVNNTLNYLKQNIQSGNYWLPIVPEVMSVPRASWWNWDDAKVRNYTFNPTCELAGYFYHFGGGDYRTFSKELLDVLYQELVQCFVGTLEMHDVISLMQLCRTLPDVMAEKFIAILKPHLKEMMVTDKKEWTNYVMSPLSVFRSPLDPLYYDFEKEIKLNLDYEISIQNEDGTWHPTWSWGQYDDEFDAREKQLISYVTLNKLVQLKNFDRISKSR